MIFFDIMYVLFCLVYILLNLYIVFDWVIEMEFCINLLIEVILFKNVDVNIFFLFFVRINIFVKLVVFLCV